MLHEPQINGVFCCHDATDRGSVGADAGRLFPPFPLGSCGQCCSAATVARNLRNLGRLPEKWALLCDHRALARAEGAGLAGAYDGDVRSRAGGSGAGLFPARAGEEGGIGGAAEDRRQDLPTRRGRRRRLGGGCAGGCGDRRGDADGARDECRDPDRTGRHSARELPAAGRGDRDRRRRHRLRAPVSRFFIARHGETVFNAAARMQGEAPHTPLTRTGFAQADSIGEALLARLGPRPRLTMWSSPAGRALQTLAIAAEHLGLDWHQARTDARLAEIDV
ncbi:MAG: histidine phosphatase family protein, partial [Alphaproteobacteria bacterium]